MEKHRKQAVILSTLGVVMILFGVTYSFFNYTRTGLSNNITVGNISFNSNQTNTISLLDVFPIDANDANSSSHVGVATINITGDTTYDDGVEYVLKVSNLTNTVGNKEIPIDVVVTASGIGEEDDDYFENHGPGSLTSIYKVLNEGTISNNQELLVGYIKKGSTGINGTVTVKAYLDKDKIGISDTYYENATETPSPTAPNDMYGTTTEWADGKTILTTDEWNNLQANGVSFQVKVEANEGTWVDAPAKEIESCPGCKYIYRVVNPSDETTFLWTTWNMGGSNQTTGDPEPITPTQITTGLYNDYEELIATTGKNYFLGVKLNNNNEVTNAYACGVKDNVSFCIEGKLYSGLGGTEAETTYAINQSLLQGTNLYNNTCTVNGDTTSGSTVCGPWDNTGSLSADAYSGGVVAAGMGGYDACVVERHGGFGCSESASGGGD